MRHTQPCSALIDTACSRNVPNGFQKDPQNIKAPSPWARFLRFPFLFGALLFHFPLFDRKASTFRHFRPVFPPGFTKRALFIIPGGLRVRGSSSAYSEAAEGAPVHGRLLHLPSVTTLDDPQRGCRRRAHGAVFHLPNIRCAACLFGAA